MRSLERSVFFAALSLLALAACGGVVVLPGDDESTGAGGDAPPSEPSCVDSASDVSMSATNGSIEVSSAVPGPACGMFATGNYYGAAVLGGAALPDVEVWDGWVARLSEDGSAAWVRRIAGVGRNEWADHVHSVVADGVGNSWIVGWVAALDLDGVDVLEGEGPFAMALDPEGEIRWARRLPRLPALLEQRADGRLALLIADEEIVQLLLLDPATGETTSETTLATGYASLMSAAIAEGRTALALCFHDQLELDGRTLLADDDTLDGLEQETCDLAIAVVDDAGGVIHARTFQEHGFSPYSARLAIDGRGFIALNASYWGRIDLGLGELVASPIGEGMRGLVAIFDGEGNTLASTAFGDAAFVFPNGVVWGDAGTLTIGATMYDGSVNLGGPVLGPSDYYLGFEGTFDGSGGHVESRVHEGLAGMFDAERGSAFWVDQLYEPENAGMTTVSVVRRSTTLVTQP